MAGNRSKGLEQLIEGSFTEWLSFAIGLVVVGILIWFFVRLVAWMRDGDDPAVSEHQMLKEIGELHREGDLDENEYRSIKEHLVDRLKTMESEPESKFDG